MQFSITKSIEILESTPGVLSAMLNNLGPEWINANEGEGTWSVKEVVAHLIVCEETDWLPRIKIILSGLTDKTFAPIDMTAHFSLSKTRSLQELVTAFTQLRAGCIQELIHLVPGENNLTKTATHPVLGEVNLKNLVAAWVTHDLAHIVQVARIMAKQNDEHVGPFKTLLRILNA